MAVAKHFPRPGRPSPSGVISRAMSGRVGWATTTFWRASGNKLEPIHFPHDDVEVPASATVDKNNNIWILSFGPNVYRGRGRDWQNLNQVLGQQNQEQHT